MLHFLFLAIHYLKHLFTQRRGDDQEEGESAANSQLLKKRMSFSGRATSAGKLS